MSEDGMWEEIKPYVYRKLGDGFRIVYNDTEIGTALIKDEVFYILMGDWRDAYDSRIPQGYEVCKAFYDSRKSEYGSPWSDV